MLVWRGARWQLAILAALAGIMALTLPTGAMAGYKTGKPSQVKVLASGWSADPLLTVGDTIGNYQMAATPDGLGTVDNGDGTFTLYMNHELTSQDKANLSDARVSRLIIDKATQTVISGDYVIAGNEGYARFCSATLVGPAEGFATPMFFTNEESTDSKFGGISLAVDTKTGKVTNMPWLGKLSHENTLVAPGFPGKTVVFTTDDSAPGGVYMFVANSSADVLTGNGQLYALAIDGTPTEADLLKGQAYTGKWVALTNDDNKDAKTLRAAMEKKGATVFARPEDATYDRNDPSTIYFATTGRSGYNNAAGKEINAKGKIHRVKMDPSDPTKVTEFRVVLDGNAGDDIVNPDNLDADKTGLMIQEDLNAEFRNRPGRLLRYDFASGKVTPILELNQKDFNGQPIAGDKPGEWESSGVIDASSILGPNTWLFDVQAHTLKTPQFGGTDEGGQLLVLRFGAAPSPAPSATPSTTPTPRPTVAATPAPTTPAPTATPPAVPGLPNTGAGGMQDGSPLDWRVLPLILILAAAAVAVALRRKVA